MTRDDSILPSDNVILTELEDGSGVLLDLTTKFYFTLNATGVVLWRALASGPRTPRELASVLSGEFAVDEASAESDVLALLGGMAEDGLVKVSRR